VKNGVHRKKKLIILILFTINILFSFYATEKQIVYSLVSITIEKQFIYK